MVKSIENRIIKELDYYSLMFKNSPGEIQTQQKLKELISNLIVFIKSESEKDNTNSIILLKRALKTAEYRSNTAINPIQIEEYKKEAEGYKIILSILRI